MKGNSHCIEENFKLDHELTTKLLPHVLLSIHKFNVVMPFRVFKFCEHSPGGLTPISNPFSCSLSMSLLPTSFYISITCLLKFTFHSFSIPTSVNHSCYMPQLWSSLICCVHANSCAWSCSSLVDFWHIKCDPALTGLSPGSSSLLSLPSRLHLEPLH